MSREVSELERENCRRKPRYATEAAAQYPISKVRRRNVKAAKRIVAYRCPVCNLWHLTSHNRRKRRRR